MLEFDPSHRARLLEQLPESSGVYFFYNAAQEIIYVGKAKSLKKRVSSYFQAKQHPIKVQRMISAIAGMDFIVLHSESEALLVECDLIKQHRPRYNVLLRDDKSYPYIRLDAHHDYPRLQAFRGEIEAKTGEYFGPYASAYAVKQTIDVLQQLFLLRQCSDHDFKTRTRPCLQYQIKRCSAPCVGYIDKKTYQDNVQHVRDYLKGDPQNMIDGFSKLMQQASESQQYEQAGQYRDKIKLLQKLLFSSYDIPAKNAVDLIAVGVVQGIYGAYCFTFRNGHCLGGCYYELVNAQDEPISMVLTSFIMQHYTHQEALPDVLLIQEQLEDKQLVLDSMQSRFQHRLKIKTELKQAWKSWYDLAVENLHQSMRHQHRQLHDFHDKFIALQTALNLSEEISRIECFDISHTQGEATYASCVVFNDAGPDKKQYRLYQIDNITPGDDYAAMRQVVQRRYTSLLEKSEALPDVILIDGGKGQLKQAVEILSELQVDWSQLSVIGVAKGVSRKPGWETLYLHDQAEPIEIAPDTMAFFLIQNVRDEAHRFAITRHRSKRAKRGLSSVLESIPGVGPQKRRQLLAFFGGLVEIKQASQAELAKAPGISHNLAEKIFKHLRDLDT